MWKKVLGARNNREDVTVLGPKKMTYVLMVVLCFNNCFIKKEISVSCVHPVP